MNAKWLKAQATAAKRTATVLRDLAKSHGIDPADSGIMLAAARTVSALASTRSAEAKSAKRQEDAREALVAKYEKDARELILTTWPTDAVLDKVTLVALNGSLVYLSRAVENNPAKMGWYLNEYFNENLRDLCRSVAYNVWNHKTTVAAELCERARKWESLKHDRKTIDLADTISALSAVNECEKQVATC